jgi:nitrogen fixation protein NifU and related proteins
MFDMYQEIILQHYRAPKNFGTIAEPTLSGEESNPLCGDHLRIDLRLDADRTKVEEVRFSGDGCAISVAAGSMLTEAIRGKPMADVRKMTQDDMLKLVGIPLSPVRVKCALTGFTALGRALHSAEVRSDSPPTASVA